VPNWYSVYSEWLSEGGFYEEIANIKKSAVIA